MTFWGLFFSDQLIYGAKPSCNQLVAGEQRGVLSAVVPSSGRFIGGDTKFGRVLVGNWANVGWRWGVSSEAISGPATFSGIRPGTAGPRTFRIMHSGTRRKRRRGKGLTAKGWKPGRPGVWYGGTSRRGTITAEQFAWERRSAGLSREDAADLLGVGLRTIGTWETGEASPSYAAFKLLRVFRHGEFIDPAWSGYRLLRGVLVTPEGRELRPTDMGWMSLLFARARLAREIAKERDALREQLANIPPQSEDGEGRQRSVSDGADPTPLARQDGIPVGSRASSLPDPSGQQRGSQDRRTVGKPRAGAAGQATDASIGLSGFAKRPARGLSLTLPERPEFGATAAKKPQKQPSRANPSGGVA